MKIYLDKIASSTQNAKLPNEVYISDEIVCKEGYILAARVLGRKDKYNELENIHGRMVKLLTGDIIAGVLGNRKALRGYSGYVPSQIRAGDRLNLLSLGGVIGKCDSYTDDLGAPIDVEILGSVLTFPSFEDRIGVPAHIHDAPIARSSTIQSDVPTLFVSGTCMNTGKTTACMEIVRELDQRGYRVVAAKLTGVSLLRDTLAMEDSGAVRTLTFNHAGAISTTHEDTVSIAKGILQALSDSRPDVQIVELGDGLAGEYGVNKILEDPELMALPGVHLVCASDPIAAWGAARYFQEKFMQTISVFSGPVTDNDVGKNFIQETLGIPAWNARHEMNSLTDFIEARLALKQRKSCAKLAS